MVHMDHFLSFSLYQRMKLLDYVNNVTKKPALCEHAKTKAQISSAVIARLKSNSHAPNLHACIIYIHVNILPVCIFAHANANTYRS